MSSASHFPYSWESRLPLEQRGSAQQAGLRTTTLREEKMLEPMQLPRQYQQKEISILTCHSVGSHRCSMLISGFDIILSATIDHKHGGEWLA